MSDLANGHDVPWYIVSGPIDPSAPKKLPPRAIRETVRPPLDPVAAAATTADAMRHVQAEISRVKAAGRPLAARALLQLESRLRWFRSVTESLKEHR